MARLIDAKEIEKQIKQVFRDSNPVLMGQMIRWIRKQPTVDAVPVVRCKDCMYYKNAEGCKPICQKFEGLYGYPKEDDFCSYGERRTDNA